MHIHIHMHMHMHIHMHMHMHMHMRMHMRMPMHMRMHRQHCNIRPSARTIAVKTSRLFSAIFRKLSLSRSLKVMTNRTYTPYHLIQ